MGFSHGMEVLGRLSRWGLLLIEDGDLVTNDREKTEALSAYFSTVFYWYGFSSATSLSLPADSLGMKQHPQQEKKELRSSYYHLDMHNFMGPLGMHPRVIKELTAQSLLSPWK